MKTDNRRADARSALQERIGDELPRLSPRDTVELAGIVERLVEALRPERIYAFGSHARGDATPDSDV
ncbi:MAG: nucleotidyltransferase domain-containing protein, partial [Chloroflexi bacterium]